MNEDQMQQDSDVRVQHLEIFRELIWFLVCKEAGAMLMMPHEIPKPISLLHFELDDCFNCL